MRVVARLKPTPNGEESIISQLDTCLILDPSKLDSVSKYKNNNNNNNNNNKRVRQHKFILDDILPMDCSQEEVYMTTTDQMLSSLLEGHNSTIFAYGATGCGKTHTITGNQNDPGLIFRAMDKLFSNLNKSDKITELSLSYLEIYNEQIRDLLQPETPSSKLNLLEVNNESIKIANLTKITPISLENIYDLIIKANLNRTVSPTMANATSSRSHAILQINLLQSTNSGLQDEIIQSTLNIIDLAGSERASATFNKGKTLNEGANINKSLLALGSCINALSESKPHIPYRNSKLTRLLKYSLGGNCKTCMIVCISPDYSHFDDSLNALKYANMAKNIKISSSITKNIVQKHIGDYEMTILNQQKLIDDLNFKNNLIIDDCINNFKSKISIINQRINLIVNSIENSIISNKFLLKKGGNYNNKNLKFKKLLLIDFINSINKYDLDSKFDQLIINLNSIIDLINSKILNNQNDYVVDDDHNDDDDEGEENEDLIMFINQSFKNHINELSNLDGWCELTENIFELKLNNLKLKYSSKGNNNDNQIDNYIYSSSSIFIDSFANLITKLEYLLDSPDVNLKLSIYGLLDSIIDNFLKQQDKSEEEEDEVKKLIITKKRQINDSEYNTPRKSSRISSLNIQMGDINIDTTDDSIDQSSPVPQAKFGLTTKRLIASPKIHSPNRLAGLGVSYQTKFKGFDHLDDDDNNKQNDDILIDQ